MAKRDLDVVVFGATGVTGRRVAGYLAERASEVGASWAAAGRDPAKVERVLAEEGVAAPETISADVADPGTLAEMAARSKVVLNLVGPYTLFGAPVIEACIQNGAHHADLSGEIPFVREVIDRFDEAATQAGVKVVQLAGYESIPADLGVALAAERAGELWNEALAEVELVGTMRTPPGMPKASDGMSGGTMQSLVEAAGADDPSIVTDPASLVTDPARAEEVRSRSPISLRPRRDGDGTPIAPMQPAAFLNPPVIHRTGALLAAEAGDGPPVVRYREGIALRGSAATLPLRFAAAGVLSAMQAGIGTLTRARPAVRRRAANGMRRVLPSSGFGPARERLDQFGWTMTIVARTTGGNSVRVELDADGHPGYLSTSRIMGEAGLILADDGATPDRAGCLTPALALGTRCAERFEHARMRISVAT